MYYSNAGVQTFDVEQLRYRNNLPRRARLAHHDSSDSLKAQAPSKILKVAHSGTNEDVLPRGSAKWHQYGGSTIQARDMFHGEAESTIWEDEFLKEATLSALLSEKTLLLRLQAGSQEAEFLAAIYPLPKTPTLIIIHNGQLKEYITSGISKDDFIQRVKLALRDGTEIIAPVASGIISTSLATNDSNQAGPSTSPRSLVPSDQEQPRAVTNKKEQEAGESAERAAKAGPAGEGPEVANLEASKKAADMKYALMQKKRQQDARDERARILKRVQADKEERKIKEALRKEEARAAMESNDPHPSIATQAMSSNLPRPIKDQNGCAVQVRLFDGTTIRSRFSSRDTLGKEVRQWVDAQREDGDIPYTFKQILTPLPNKTIMISEEEESLQSLGLNPTATLILIPVKDYTTAYGSGVTSYISGGISAGVGLVSSTINMVTGTLSSFIAGNATSGGQVEHETGSSSQAPGPANIRTLRDQGGNTEGSQFYNGNTLNFEPRRDDDDKQD